VLSDQAIPKSLCEGEASGTQLWSVVSERRVYNPVCNADSLPQLAYDSPVATHLIRLVAHKYVSLQSEAELSSAAEAAVCCCVAAVWGCNRSSSRWRREQHHTLRAQHLMV
jgi:hypothetical protein